MIAIDEGLREAVSDEAKCIKKDAKAKAFVDHPERVKQLQMQPDLDALRAIDKLFRERGLVLSVYALAEINRWFFGNDEEKEEQAKHRNKFKKELELLKNSLKPFLGPEFNGFGTRSSALMEAIGVLVADPDLRDHFLKNTMTLREHGFELSPEEEDALRRGFESGSQGTQSAKGIHRLGWSEDSACTSRLLVYDQLFHLNN